MASFACLLCAAAGLPAPAAPRHTADEALLILSRRGFDQAGAPRAGA